jgi:CDP-glycerol glycerophosphotransferase (TagB/SpsB family)
MATFPDVELAAEAKQRGISTLGMTSNWDHLNKYFIPRQTDHFLVQNEPMRREAIKLHNYRPERVSLVGFPQFDVYADPKRDLIPRSEFCAHFGIPESAKIILYVSGSAYALDEPDILKAIAGWLREGAFGEARLMVRPYVNLRERELEEKKYASLNDDPMIVFNWMKHDERDEHKQFYRSMLAYADIVLSVFSTMAIEAAILDKPTLTIGFDGHHRRPSHQSVVRLEELAHFRHVLDTGSVPIIRNFTELREQLLHYLAHPEDGRDKRRALVEHLCYKMDGNASERIARQVYAHV